jgi:hypothetical protein
MKLIPPALVLMAVALWAWPLDKPAAVGLMVLGLLALGLSTPNDLDQV